jgi:formate-dependent nitrite reductase cytochrome c552 subunit
MQCHHARRSPDNQVIVGNPSRPASFGPHESPQGDMVAGKSGYHGVAPAGFNWASPSHLNIQNSCKTCHLNMVEWSPSGPAVTGHKFEPTTLACQNCHGVINDFAEIPAADDFDGDGSVEGLQHEVEGLLDLLTASLVADGLDTTNVGIGAALGDSSNSTQLQREAGYNLIFVEADHSLGVHNPDYTIQLLQQSYRHLTGTLPKNMAIVEGDNSVVMNW